jgi:hypothetical protein
VQFNCVKKLHDILNWMFSGTAHFFNQVCQLFFVSYVECLEMMPSWCRQVKWGNCGIPWVNCAVICVKDWKGQLWGQRYCLSKLCSLLCWVSWDDAIVVSTGKVRELWDSLSKLRSSLCERLERTVLRLALLPVKTVQFIQFFRQVWRHTEKSLSLTESV